MAEGRAAIPVEGTTSPKGNPREVWLTPHLRGQIVLTVYAGQKPVDVVIPIRALNEAIRKLDDSV
jgi:hypothetical protein